MTMLGSIILSLLLTHLQLSSLYFNQFYEISVKNSRKSPLYIHDIHVDCVLNMLYISVYVWQVFFLGFTHEPVYLWLLVVNKCTTYTHLIDELKKKVDATGP